MWPTPLDNSTVVHSLTLSSLLLLRLWLRQGRRVGGRERRRDCHRDGDASVRVAIEELARRAHKLGVEALRLQKSIEKRRHVISEAVFLFLCDSFDKYFMFILEI